MMDYHMIIDRDQRLEAMIVADMTKEERQAFYDAKWQAYADFFLFIPRKTAQAFRYFVKKIRRK